MAFISGPSYANGNPRAMWVATYTSFILWLFHLIVLYLVSGLGSRKTRDDRNTAAVGADDRVDKVENTWYARIKRATKVARHLFFILFSTTVITVLGYGATGGTVTLLWIIFGVGIVWALAELFISSSWLREVMAWIMYPLAVIIWGLSFRQYND
ncbi:hypothetical protein BKA69DRAFT_1081139 [Paraphysoderma sedebokerense]|nr:hypothetical protein BKA69DRAFT_1081139 [Paraphysoderma sedebokerense]